MTSWTEHVIWWQVYPLGFVGAEDESQPGAEVVHRLGRVTGWLDHLIDLGCNGLALGPVFTSETHGYDTTDFFAIDPRLGDGDDFDALIAACRDKGIRVLLDGVFNHAGRSFEPVREALAGGESSEAGGWVRWSDGYPYYFEGVERLITFDHASQRVRDFVVDVMCHWLDRGIDGWRLDAAFAVPADFWAEVVPRVRERHPDAWFVAEMLQGPYAEYVRDSGLDSITQYELWKAIWSSLREANLWELDWTLGRNNDLLAHLVPMTFLGNHDVTRVASQIPDRRHLSHAVALLFFLPGIPSVYYGDEFGFRAVKEDRLGGDDAIRPEMPDSPDDVTAEDDLRSTYQQLIGLRRRHPWLTAARTETRDLADEHVSITATGPGGERLTLVLNLSDAELPLDGTGDVVESSVPTDASVLPPHAWLLHSD